ncbi:hypothetical protein Tco_0462911 [Tanacetum coccineum]
MGWVVYSDVVMRSSNAVLVFVVTASRYIGDAISSQCREILEQCWCRDIPLDSVVVLRYEKRSKSENKGKVPTEMELVLEQTQQGTSYEVSVSAEGVEELKRKVKIKGEKKEAILTLRQKPEHQSDTQVITMKMEILLEPTSNKLMVEHAEFDESNTYVLDIFDTSSGSHVKDILLKLNLPDHRFTKRWSWSDKVVKLKNFKKDAPLKLFKFTNQERYEHVGLKVTSLQDGEKRLCLVDDLKKFKITFMLSQRYKSKPKVKNHYINSQVNDYELKTKVKSIVC